MDAGFDKTDWEQAEKAERYVRFIRERRRLLRFLAGLDFCYLFFWLSGWGVFVAYGILSARENGEDLLYLLIRIQSDLLLTAFGFLIGALLFRLRYRRRSLFFPGRILSYGFSFLLGVIPLIFGREMVVWRTF